MLEIFKELEQGSEQWLQLRAGIVTASEFSQVLAKGAGKTRRTLLFKKAGERITGDPMNTYSNEHMERGTEQEGVARDLYIAHSGNEVTECGFMKNGNAGYSPDGLIGNDGLVEIKSRLAHIQADSLLKDAVPSENIAQIQGGLWISQRRYLDYVSYCPGMPLFIKRVESDLDYQDKLSHALQTFETELSGIVSQLIEKF
ncbi:MAG: lambda exonuclease family protein [Candidatus Bathyarchaeia archaeon]